MVTVEQIKSEILNFTVLKDVIEVEFDDYILEVNKKDLEGIEVGKDTLAKIIYEKYL